MLVWCDWQVTLCDPHLSALEVSFSGRCAIQIDVYLYLYLYCAGIYTDVPRCSGVTRVNAGNNVSLVCESTYSGNEKPQLHWYRRVHRRHRVFDDELPSPQGRYGHTVHSLDEFDIRETGPVARQVISWRVYTVTFHCIVYTLSGRLFLFSFMELPLFLSGPWPDFFSSGRVLVPGTSR